MKKLVSRVLVVECLRGSVAIQVLGCLDLLRSLVQAHSQFQACLKDLFKESLGIVKVFGMHRLKIHWYNALAVIYHF
jgi:hypothetical protein